MFILKFYENEGKLEFFLFFFATFTKSSDLLCSTKTFSLCEECVRAKLNSMPYTHGTLLVRIFLEFYGEFRMSDNNNFNLQHGAAFGEK